MRTIPITRGKAVLVDDEDYLSLASHKWHYLPNGGYAIRTARTAEGRRTVLMHRQIINPPLGFQVDHKNGDGLDNRRSNLRVCTLTENNRNTRCRRTNRLRVKGVAEIRGRFYARISPNRKTIWLGGYATIGEAKAAYDLAAKQYFGEFASL